MSFIKKWILFGAGGIAIIMAMDIYRYTGWNVILCYALANGFCYGFVDVMFGVFGDD